MAAISHKLGCSIRSVRLSAFRLGMVVATSVSVCGFDQFTKHLLHVRRMLWSIDVPNTDISAVAGVLGIMNHGWLLGVGDEWDSWLNPLLMVTCSALYGLSTCRHALDGTSRRAVLSRSVLLGGLMGNVLDRLLFGGVRDMLYLGVGAHGIVANVADVAIIFGLVTDPSDDAPDNRQSFGESIVARLAEESTIEANAAR